MDAITEVEALNAAIEGGKRLTTPIWKGVYTPESQYEIVYALGPRLLKVQLPNPEEGSWTKEIEVESEEWHAILAQAGILQ
jgi:hypothetical protein